MSFFSDLLNLGTDTARNAAQGEARRLTSRIGFGQVDTVPYQNQVVADFGNVLSSYQSGRLSNAETIRQIDLLNQSFQAFVRAIGTPRAMRGAGEVNALAQRIISDRQREASGGISTTGVTVPVPGIGSTTISYTTMALAGVALYLLFSRKRLF